VAIYDQRGTEISQTMSHELRTPLKAILGFTGTLLMRMPGALAEAQSSN
jgi:signal transduction histidine kinase